MDYTILCSPFDEKERGKTGFTGIVDISCRNLGRCLVKAVVVVKRVSVRWQRNHWKPKEMAYDLGVELPNCIYIVAFVLRGQS